MDKTAKHQHRADAFKAKGVFKADEVRRRRDNAGIEIRKQKREESLAKRRNFHPTASDTEDESPSANTNDLVMIILLYSANPLNAL
jgi:hypothetical protein